MDLYQAKDDYLTALKKYDSRVLVNSHGKTLRPYYFLKTEIEGQQLFLSLPLKQTFDLTLSLKSISTVKTKRKDAYFYSI